MNILRMLWRLVPPQNKPFYSLCKRYVDRYNGENNDNILTNGELRLMRLVLPHCETVFDVGANVGEWTTLALTIKRDLKIHCFEPSAATFGRLTAADLGRGITYNNCGLSSVPATLPLYVFQDGSGLNSLYVRRGLEDGWGLATQSKTELIQVDALDDYCRRSNIRFIDFLKVDVEGHELEVFKGGSKMLSDKAIKHIQFEYGGCNIDSRVLLKDIFEYFASYHYAFYKIFPHELRYVPRYDQRLENYRYQNWVIISKA